MALSDQTAADVVAVDTGQVAVQHDHVVASDAGPVQGLLAVQRDINAAMPSRRSPAATASAIFTWSSATSTLISTSRHSTGSAQLLSVPAGLLLSKDARTAVTPPSQSL